MSIAITPKPSSKVRATADLDPNLSVEEIAQRTGVHPAAVRHFLAARPKRRIKSVARS